MCTIIEEEWRDIAGYEGLYQISNLGRVKSLNRMINGSYGSKKVIKCRMLRPVDNSKGYKCVLLCKDGKKCRTYIHHIVAQAFVANPDKCSEVNHKDEDKSNNRADNLEWCTRRYNVNYGTARERITNNMTGPYKSKQVICVETGIVYASSMEAERKTGASHSNIIKCCLGKQKTTGGYHWKYSD